MVQLDYNEVDIVRKGVRTMAIQDGKGAGQALGVGSDGEASLGGGGGPTDEVFYFTHDEAHDTPLIPIVGVDVDAQIITAHGDLSTILDLLILVPNGGGFNIVGSTGNDSILYQVTSYVYDPESDTTAITLNTVAGSSLSDATPDGSIQCSVLYLVEIPIAANGAVEWVLIETLTEWSGGFYGVIGDNDQPEAFCSRVGMGVPGGADVSAVGRWQWPINTVSAASTSPHVLIGDADGIKFYEEDNVIRTVWSEVAGGSQGQTRITVHHHYAEPLSVRFPASE